MSYYGGQPGHSSTPAFPMPEWAAHVDAAVNRMAAARNAMLARREPSRSRTAAYVASVNAFMNVIDWAQTQDASALAQIRQRVGEMLAEAQATYAAAAPGSHAAVIAYQVIAELDRVQTYIDQSLHPASSNRSRWSDSSSSASSAGNRHSYYDNESAKFGPHWP
ncbi:hypothetical protein JCM10908_005359 [Rhodotorula pacifica]|uniref:uncharacterized protein n=1 Tax=Rhodotorula pacifica TaxID=1495444 RepID=UPI0031750E1E